MLITVLVLIAALIFSSPLEAQRNFGSATALSGEHAFVSQPSNFYGPGAVYVYDMSTSPWAEVHRLYAPDSSIGDRFGWSLSAHDGTVLVGSPRRDGTGSAHLFSAGGGWSGSRMTDPAGDGTGFGASVALGDGFGFVGAPNAGQVHLINTRGTPSIASTLDHALGAESGFGTALSLEGDLLLVGAPNAESRAGAVIVYRRQGAGWVAEDVITGPPARGRSRSGFGATVHLDDGRAFVGAPGANAARGAVMVFENNGSSWEETGQLALEDGRRGTQFGTALATSGAEIWVGAPRGEDGDGAVYRFTSGGDGSWASAGAIVPDSSGTGAWPFGFGTSVAAWGDRAVIGMATRDFGEGRAGFYRNVNRQWRETTNVYGDIAKIVTSIETGTECENDKLAAFDCSNVEVVSFTPVSDLGGARGVWVNDVWGWTDPETRRDFAIVSRRDGAAFVELTDPSQPRLVGSLLRTEGSRPSVWRDIKVIGTHAYIVSDGAGQHGMQVFDLTRLRNVSNPPVTFDADAHYDGIASAHNVVADTSSGFLYIVGANGGGNTCGGGLHMVDARNPTEPSFAGCYTSAAGGRSRGYTHDAQCLVYNGPDTRYRGRQICVGSNEVEINIADVTDKDQPVLIGRNSYPNAAYAHQGWFDESQRYFYMGDELDEMAGGLEGTRTLVWDLQQLDDPVLLKEYIAPVRATDHNLYIRGNLAYMSNYGSGLRVLDISDPTDPKEIAFLDSAPLGDNDPGTSSAQSGAWSNYPFFESGLVVFTSVREGLFVVRVKPPVLIP